MQYCLCIRSTFWIIQCVVSSLTMAIMFLTTVLFMSLLFESTFWNFWSTMIFDWMSFLGTRWYAMAVLDLSVTKLVKGWSTTKTVSAAFHLNNKEAKCDLKVKYNNETLPFCFKPKYLESNIGRKLTSRVALLWWLAGSGWGTGATTLRIATLALVHSTAEYCVPVLCRSAQYLPHRPRHQWPLANCDWMPVPCTSRQPSNPRRHPTC